MDGNDDLEHYSRIPTIDLIAEACEVTFPSAQNHVHYEEIKGVKIPYLKPALLIETKMGVRPKDVQDRLFLQRLIERDQE
jgi:hypothetical protein